MYEGDTPRAERRAVALALDRELLRELLGQEELRDLIDPSALEQVEDDLQHRSEHLRARDADGLHDVLRRVGDLTDAEVRGARRRGRRRRRPGCRSSRSSGVRALVRVAGERALDRRREEAGLYRDALGVAPPGGAARGLPGRRARRAGRSSCGATLARTGRSRPATSSARFGVDASAVLAALEQRGELVRGELRPLGTQREWCDPDVLRRVRRASLAALRREIEPVDREALARFAPAWQGVDRQPAAGAGVERLRDVLAPLQGLPLAPELWEHDVLPRRLGAYSPAWLDELCATGELVWVGAGATGGRGRPSRLVLSRRRPAARSAGGTRAAGRVAPRSRARAPACRRLLLHRPARGTPRACRPGPARGTLGPRLVRRGHQRRVRPVALSPGGRVPPPGRARARVAQARPRALSQAPAPHGAASGTLVADRGRLCRTHRRRRRTAAGRGPSCSSNATASSPASSCAPRASPAALPPSTRRSRPSRRSARPPRLLRRRARRRAVRAARGGRAPARARGRRRRRGACWPSPIPPSSTASALAWPEGDTHAFAARRRLRRALRRSADRLGRGGRPLPAGPRRPRRAPPLATALAALVAGRASGHGAAPGDREDRRGAGAGLAARAAPARPGVPRGAAAAHSDARRRLKAPPLLRRSR